MTTKEFIEKAIEGGWKIDKIINPRGKHGVCCSCAVNQFEKTILDPKAWEAVGKTEMYGIWQTKDKMHMMIDALIEGKSIEEYIATL